MTEVIIPWRPGDELRQANLAAVERHLEVAGFDPVIAVVVTGLWSPGRARNAGARLSEALVYIFNDADSVCPPAQVREAARLAASEPGLVFAYDLYCRVDERTSAIYRAGREPNPEEDLFPGVVWTMQGSSSMACVAIHADCFKVLGGFDERYLGWGYEDIDFVHRALALWPLRRVPGPVFHLWHGARRGDDSPLDADPELAERNRKRWETVR